MRLKIILETITAFVCGAQAIVGGIAASNEDLPFIVSVARTSHQCSGVLISPSAVLTDPECVEQGRVTSLKVRAGTRRHASGGVLEQVSKIDIHQDYVPGTPKGRIAILHLAAAVPASSGDRKIQEAPLPSQETSSGTKLVAGGWGLTSQGSRRRCKKSRLRQETSPSARRYTPTLSSARKHCAQVSRMAEKVLAMGTTVDRSSTKPGKLSD
jgi:hypothetical protein